MDISRIRAGAFDYWFQVYDLFLQMQDADEDEEPNEILDQDVYQNYLELRRMMAVGDRDIVEPLRHTRQSIYQTGINVVRKTVLP